MGALRRHESDRPFDEAFSRLKAERGLSLRQIAALVLERSGRSVSPGHLGDLANGLERPSAAMIVALAAALDVEPTYFAEYRLAQARHLFNEAGPDGLAGALEQLERLPHELRERARSMEPADGPTVAPAYAGPSLRRRAA